MVYNICIYSKYLLTIHLHIYQLVDSEVFEHLHRRGEQQVIESQTNNPEGGH